MNHAGDLVDVDRLSVERVDACLIDRYDGQILLRLFRLLGAGHVDFDSVLHHVRRQHEYDEQDQHHVDERGHIDLADGAPAAAPARSVPAAVRGERHGYCSPKLRSARLRNSSEKSSMRAPISRMMCPK